MPVLVRLLMCAALFGVLGASAPAGEWSQDSANAPATHLPTTNSLSGYIIAVG
jgi:hypothetical protein